MNMLSDLKILLRVKNIMDDEKTKEMKRHDEYCRKVRKEMQERAKSFHERYNWECKLPDSDFSVEVDYN